MYGLSTIVAMNNLQTEKALKQGKRPFVILNLEWIEAMPPFPFPHLGSGDDPPGWEFMDKLWCVDRTGMDTCGPAFSVEGFKRELKRFLQEEVGGPDDWMNVGFGITTVAEFQVDVGAFRRVTSDSGNSSKAGSDHPERDAVHPGRDPVVG